MFTVFRKAQESIPKIDSNNLSSETVFFELIRSLGINSNESILPAYVAYVGMTTLFLLGSLAPTDCSKILVLAGRYDNPVPTRFLAPIYYLKFQHWTVSYTE